MNRLLNAKIIDTPKVHTHYPPKNMLWHCPCRKRYGILFCISGKSIFTQNGKETISDPSKVVFLPKGANYTLYEAKGGEFYSINFDCQLPEPMTQFLSFDSSQQDKFIKVCKRIQELNSLENKELKLMKYTYEIIDMVVFEYNRINYPLTPLISYIDNNYSNSELTNYTLAQESGYSETYMRLLFKTQFNTSPKQYLLNIRLNNASRMLTETNKKISQICIDCGFLSLSHFCRIFKERFGESPSEYRINHKYRKNI